MKPRFIRDVRKLAAKALASGGRQHSKFRISWNIAGRCESPELVEVYGRDYADKPSPGRPKPLLVELSTKCRKCAQCKRERQYLWSWRSVEEWSESSRTWAGTLTYAPENLFLLVSKTRLRLARGGTNFDLLTAQEQFEELHKTLGRELTLWLKRVRKNTGAPMRYLLVTELHKSGAPHHHVLMHEVTPENPLRKAALESSWQLGFSAWRLVKDRRGATYVTKYLTKENLVRVRASKFYGRQR